MRASSIPSNGETTTTSTKPFAWGEGFMDVVARYERNSERQLYVYGISVSRCASCRHRLKKDATECENCGHPVSTKFKKCTRCPASNPGLWCYECDAYFCESCRKVPHVLVLNGSAPEHNCFPIDGSSGKLLRSGSWSSSMLTLAKTARRSQMRLAENKLNDSQTKTTEASSVSDTTDLTNRMENMHADEKTSVPEKEKKQAAKETVRVGTSSRPPPIPSSGGRQANQAQPKSFSRGPVRSRSPSPIPSNGTQAHRSPSPLPSTAPQQLPHKSPSPIPSAAQPQPVRTSPSPIKHHEATPPPAATILPPRPVRADIVGDVHSTGQTSSVSRKRKSPTVDGHEGADQSSIPPPPPQRPAGDSTATVQAATEMSIDSSAETPDGMSLYARLRQMKDQEFHRTHSATASPSTNTKTEAGTPTPSSSSNGLPTPTTSQFGQASAAVASHTTEPSHSLHSAQREVQVADDSSAVHSTMPSTSMKTDPTLDEDLSRPIEAPPASVVGVPAVAQAAGIGGFTPSTAVDLTDSEDVLQDAVVEAYINANTYTFAVEERITKLSGHVHRALANQDMVLAARINAHLQPYRQEVRKSEEQRERALANVILFSPEIRAFARTLTPMVLQDNTHAVKALHTKCFNISKRIREAKAKRQALQEAIGTAALTGDTTQMITLGSHIDAVEEVLRGHKKELMGAFQQLLQFSKSLRDSVQAASASIRPKPEATRPS